MRTIQLLIACTFLFSWSATAQLKYTRTHGTLPAAILEFSQRGDLLLAANESKLEQWIAATGQLSKRGTVNTAHKINDLAFSSSDTVYISNGGKDILVYNIKNPANPGRLKGHHKKVTSIKIDADANQLFSSSMDKGTILWSLGNNGILKRFNDHKKYVLATAMSAGNGRFASCGADGYVNIYERNGERIFSQKISGGWLWAMDFSYDANTLAVGGDKSIYIITDINEKTPKVATLNDIKGKAYALKFSPDAKYLAVGTTKQYIYLYDWAANQKHFSKKVKEGTVTDLEFDPEGKSMVTAHARYRGFLKWDLRSMNILPSKYVRNVQDKMPPQIYVSNPARASEERVVVYTDVVKLQGTVIDESGVFKLTVNGIATPVSDNGSFTLLLPLSYAETPVTIEAYDINKNVSLKRFTLIRKDVAGSDYDPAKAKNYLLVIGINNYQNWKPLNNAVNDANAIAGTLSGLYSFDFSDITLLLDSQATRNNIYNTMRSYAEKIGPNDNFMVYFSGHGYFDKILNEGYWVPVDGGKKENGSFLSNSDILKIIKSINSQHTLLVADACFSGSLFNESSRGYEENVEKFRSRWGFASGRLEVVSDGEIGKNSPFAQSLLEYLRKNNKEKIAISELIQAVKMGVPEGSDQTPIGNPLKNVGDEGGEFIFYKRK